MLVAIFRFRGIYLVVILFSFNILLLLMSVGSLGSLVMADTYLFCLPVGIGVWLLNGGCVPFYFVGPLVAQFGIIGGAVMPVTPLCRILSWGAAFPFCSCGATGLMVLSFSSSFGAYIVCILWVCWGSIMWCLVRAGRFLNSLLIWGSYVSYIDFLYWFIVFPQITMSSDAFLAAGFFLFFCLAFGGRFVLPCFLFLFMFCFKVCQLWWYGGGVAVYCDMRLEVLCQVCTLHLFIVICWLLFLLVCRLLVGSSFKVTVFRSFRLFVLLMLSLGLYFFSFFCVSLLYALLGLSCWFVFFRTALWCWLCNITSSLTLVFFLTGYANPCIIQQLLTPPISNRSSTSLKLLSHMAYASTVAPFNSLPFLTPTRLIIYSIANLTPASIFISVSRI